MAQKTHIIYESDLSGKAIEDNDQPTIMFGWDGQEYAIDLTSAEAEKFYGVLEKYISVATKVTGKKGKKTSVSTGPSAKEVREWAAGQGIDVPDRGRVPSSVREAYDAAH